MKGSLTEGLLPEVLRQLYVGRKTGFLHFNRQGERRSVYFRAGHIVHADTNVKDERLGETLVTQGVLAAGDLKRATGFVLRDKKRLGVVLVELGILDRDRLEDALGVHVGEILRKVFSWSEGEYEFEEKEDAGLEPDMSLKLSTGEMILEAVRSVDDPDVIRFALGNLDRILGLTNDPLLRFQKIPLTPADGYVLSRIDGTLSGRELLQVIPMVQDETLRSLYCLVSTGIVEFLPLPPKAPPKPDARPVGVPANARHSAPMAPSAAGNTDAPSRPRPAASPPPAPASDEAAQQREARRVEVLEAFDGLKTRNHFEALGIPKASSEAQVKEAYFKLARKFHPDTHHDPSLADLREKIEAIFIRLGEAYEVLRNPRTRGNYEADLASRMPRVPAGTVIVGTSEPEPPPDPAYEARLAEESYRKAGKLFAQEKYWDAIQLLEPALETAESKVKTRIRVLLAKAYMKNPKWIKRAEEQLQAVVQAEPKNVEARMTLGSLYKASGLKARALHEFERVLELKPEHEEAAAEVLELIPEGPPSEDGGKPGFLKKLFKKG
jgi:curved DNA-binding protein CbpA